MATSESSNKEQQDLQEQLNALRNDFSEITQTVREMSANRAHQGQEKLRETADRTRAQVRESLHSVQGEIEQRPYASMAAAFGVGLLLGKLLDR